ERRRARRAPSGHGAETRARVILLHGFVSVHFDWNRLHACRRSTVAVVTPCPLPHPASPPKSPLPLLLGRIATASWTYSPNSASTATPWPCSPTPAAWMPSSCSASRGS